VSGDTLGEDRPRCKAELCGIVSDIHGNLEALEAVVQAGLRRGVQRWICLGDIVGYGADPAACIAVVRGLTRQVVLGNHDAAVVGRLDPSYFNAYAREAVRWTAAALAKEDRRFLVDLPVEAVDGEAFYVHASPLAPEAWDYVFDPSEAARALSACRTRLCFIGHTHHPFVGRQSDSGIVFVPFAAGSVGVGEGRRHLVNVGSVGQPRDGDPRASFCLWDPKGDFVEIVRVDYDIGRARAKILAAGLPVFLAARLEHGK
jgi:diadenosine tetraphosphatase ApaH/serine/threonine PP2A family protein phosphatase